MKLKTFTDGGARGNPGPAALGVAIYNEQFALIKEFGEYIGETTNNQAEYRALLAALSETHTMGADEVECFLDSELVVKQMKGEYRVKNAELALIYMKIWNLVKKFKKVSFRHIPREKNKVADAQVNIAIDAYLSHRHKK